MKYYKFIREFFKSMPKMKLILFLILSIFLSFYIVAITFLAYSDLTVITVLIFMAYAVIIFYLLIYLCYKLKDKHIVINTYKEKLNIKYFILPSLICFIVLGLTLLAYYPGGISPDNSSQWLQVQSFKFNNWHPVAHTLIIWLITRICNHYAFVIFVQIIVFSIAVGYLISTLKAWGFSNKLLIIVELSILLNSMTRNIMMYVWKDTAMTISILFLFIQCINIYLTDGIWLKKYRNVIALSVCIVITSLVRHNGFFFTLPLLFLIFILYFKKAKQVIVMVITTAIIYLSVTGPLYSVLNVTYPDNVYEESVGIPMTIMGDVMKKNPDALSDKTKEFLNRVASDKQWEELYVCGDYNSIKFEVSPAEVIKSVPVKDFIDMTIDTIKRDKRNSFLAIRELTGFVWKVNGEGERINVGINGDYIGYSYEDTAYNKFGKLFTDILDTSYNIPVFDWFLTLTGVQMLAIMLFGLYSFYKNDSKSLMFVIPSVCYNLGTMLLLCGKDYRFFHFNAVITIAACIVLSVKRSRL